MVTNGARLGLQVQTQGPLPRQRRSASAGLRWCGAMVRRDQRGADMTRSKGRASAKPRSGAKSRSKAKRAKPVVNQKPANPSRRRCWRC